MRRRFSERATAVPKPTAAERMQNKLAGSIGERLRTRIWLLRAAYICSPSLVLPSFADVCPWVTDLMEHGPQVLDNTERHVFGAFVENFFEYSSVLAGADGTGGRVPQAGLSYSDVFARQTQSRWESFTLGLAGDVQAVKLAASGLRLPNYSLNLTSGMRTEAKHRSVRLTTHPWGAADSPEYADYRMPEYRIQIAIASLAPIQGSNAVRDAHRYELPEGRAPASSSYEPPPLFVHARYAGHPAVRALQGWQAVAQTGALELDRAHRVLCKLFLAGFNTSIYGVMNAIPGLRATMESLAFDLRDDNYLPVRGRDTYDMAALRSLLPNYAEEWVWARGVLAGAVLATDVHAQKQRDGFGAPPRALSFPLRYTGTDNLSPV